MNPPLAPSPIKRKLSDSPPDSSLETPSTFVFGTANLATLRSPPPSGRLEQGREDRKYDGSTIYISFSDINESAVREILEPYGPILNIHLDENKCYAFVTLTSEEMAEKALKLDKSKYQNHRLRVNFARRNRQQSRDGNVDVGPTHQTPRPPSWGGGRAFNSYSDIHLHLDGVAFFVSRVAVFFHSITFPILSMLCRLRPALLSCQSVVVRRVLGVSSASIDIYVGANRSRFYRTLGLFCLFQGSAWSLFGGYLFSKSAEPITWDSIKADVNSFNSRLASRLESWTPDAIAKIILRPRKPSTVDAAEPAVKAKEVEKGVEKEADEQAKKGEEPLLATESKDMASRMRLAFGLAKNDNSISQTNDSSKRLIPLLCLVMDGAKISLLTYLFVSVGAFTFFVGAVIPRQVVRRISLLSRQPSSLDHMVCVSTYGWFGCLPRGGAQFNVPLNSVRTARAYKEGDKFMTIFIGQRVFIFYLERFQTEFILPEFLEHLNPGVIPKK
ncbi:unnamed protein product [Mesocestoides corti]|uniref:RRM domain-containing protein n=1 Tax=Mesocestoides corti TaxID=53468 RepID=A0A0R3UF13_MESCO|nr:unnamed protein product [Mesocestoides corti]